jgi:mxaJ protein
MSSRCLELALALALALIAIATGARAQGELRACVDPDNLPFSNAKGEGFEDRLAQMLADDLGETLTRTYWPQRRGFVRNTLKAGTCDVVLGVPSASDLLLVTHPYYRSTYVVVTRGADGSSPSSLDDPRLKTLRVGVQLIGDDGDNTPPAHALARRGIVGNVRGFSVVQDRGPLGSADAIVRAVASGEIDAGFAWGPQAAWAARALPTPLTLTPVTPQIELPFQPMVFDVSLGVRRGETGLRDRLDAALVRLKPRIDALLDEYGVPRP